MATKSRFALLGTVLMAGSALASDAVSTAGVDASLAQVQGTVLVNQGERFVAAAPGLALKKNDRIMAMDDSAAVVKYFEGCEFRVEAGTVATLPEQLPCECGDFSQTSGAIGRIVEAVGDVQFGQGGQFSGASAGQSFAVGQVLRAGSGSRAIIEFRDGCRTEVAADSAYTIPSRSPCSCAAVAIEQVGPPPTVAEAPVKASGTNWGRLAFEAVLVLAATYPDDDDGVDRPVSP